jgi:hypothetical protein
MEEGEFNWPLNNVFAGENTREGHSGWEVLWGVEIRDTEANLILPT